MNGRLRVSRVHASSTSPKPSRSFHIALRKLGIYKREKAWKNLKEDWGSTKRRLQLFCHSTCSDEWWAVLFRSQSSDASISGKRDDNS